MNYDAIIAGIMAELAALPALSGVFGDAIFVGGNQEHVVPSIQLHNVGDTETELWAPVALQIDIFHADPAAMRAAERVIRERYRADLPIPIGNLNAFSQFTGGTDLETPSRDRYFGRAIRFTITPLRAAYTGG